MLREYKAAVCPVFSASRVSSPSSLPFKRTQPPNLEAENENESWKDRDKLGLKVGWLPRKVETMSRELIPSLLHEFVRLKTANIAAKSVHNLLRKGLSDTTLEGET